MTLIGYARSDFHVKDTDTTVTGYNIYIAQPIAPERGRGKSVERYYITDAKLAACGVDLASAYGKDVHVYFNRYGKIDSLALA